MTVATVDAEGVPALPEDVGSPLGKLVALSLATGGRATADELAAGLDVPKLTLLSVLGSLENRGVVERDGGRYALA